MSRYVGGLSFLLLLGLTTTAYSTAIRYDFGNGSVDSNTGVAANFVVADESALGTLTNTQGGIQMSLTGVTSDPGGGVYDSNSQGFGIRSADDSNDPGENANAERRIDTAGDGETVQFSFDTDVILRTTRIGSMASIDEGFMISFVSGVDPFGGGNFSYMTLDGGATEGGTFDIPLGSINVNAGTVLEFSVFNAGGGGLLWNDLVVLRVPEPSSLLLASVLMPCLLRRNRRNS